MIRKIGEEFEYEGKRLKVVECDNCLGCYFRNMSWIVPCNRPGSSDIIGPCSPVYRDGHGVIFVEVKGGER